MTILQKSFTDGRELDKLECVAAALENERARIARAIAYLRRICDSLEANRCDVTVMKSLDHWPDLGSDIDLYTNAQPMEAIKVFRECFHAEISERSWGDRLAHKWNFVVPGLPELVEVHMGRLGQTGELVRFGQSLPSRSRVITVGDHSFQVTSVTDRLIICTLQRMYRHFFIRLCDVADTVELLDSGSVDFEDLHETAQVCGAWEGVATFLVVVSDCAELWRGRGLDLPEWVRSDARFDAAEITFARDFLRVPILPHSLRLYASEWTNLAAQGQIRNTARLSLLPWLATAAALGQKITGSDKGIW
jgi:hypothetical protein